METHRKLYEVTRELILRRTLAIASLDEIWLALKTNTTINGWKVVEQHDTHIRELTIPHIADWEPCFVVEYAPAWDGEGVRPNDGESAYIPQRLVQQLGVRAAFELTTGVDARHLMQSWIDELDQRYTQTGAIWEEITPEMTLHEFVQQALAWPLAYDTFTAPDGNLVLIAKVPDSLVKEPDSAIRLIFSLYDRAHENAIARWTLTSPVDEAQLAATATLFGSNDARAVQGTASP